MSRGWVNFGINCFVAYLKNCSLLQFTCRILGTELLKIPSTGNKSTFLGIISGRVGQALGKNWSVLPSPTAFGCPNENLKKSQVGFFSSTLL